MKKTKFTLFGSLLLSLAMLFGLAFQGGFFNKEIIDDPITYEDEGIVNYNNPYKKTADSESFTRPDKIILHYHNDDNGCLTRRFYTWVTGVDGIERTPNVGEWSAVDMAIELDLTEITDYSDSISLFFIIKVAGTWAGQSEDTELKYEDYTIKDGVLEVWTIPGEGTSLEIYETEEETKLPKIQTAKFVDFKTIHCECTIDSKGNEWVPTEYKLYAYDKNYLASTESAQSANKSFYLYKSGNPTTNKFDIVFNYTAKINIQYVIESIFPGYDRVQKIIVSSEYLYESERFENFYTYKGDDLGVTYTSTATTFKVWSPISAFVAVNIYNSGVPRSLGGSDARNVYKMNYVKGGIWEVTILGDLKGKYYTYTLTHSSGTMETMDPYAKASGINGLRGYIYDKNDEAANPEGWDEVPAVWNNVSGYDIKTPQDLSIYEVHIRDLTMDDTWITNSNNMRGTYDAFSESGTTYTQDNKTVTTGYDHIKELGVKAIQLLPVFDQDNDERPEKMKFNWGYNPLNYNCVEGGYSTDPYNPLAAIREYKNLIKEYSKKRVGHDEDEHTRVIMDVVYNHVSSASSSCFSKTMPKYYFRYDANWNYYDGSGCSNEVKSDATMMRKYIVDSLVWWATEYKIKGFRFDLMALIDTLTLKQAKEALYAIDPDIYIYGEGWTSGGYHGRYETIQVDDPERGNQFIVGSACAGDGHDSLVYSQLYETTRSKGYVGGFNNAGRDNLKGSNDDGWNGNPYPTWGFMNKGASDVGGLSDEVASLLKGGNTWAPGWNPRQTVSYASCHDNYTLWDQLRYTLAGSYNGDHTPNNAPDTMSTIKASIATHGVIFAANTASFIQGGEELYRTKSYSYDLEDLERLMHGELPDNSDAIVRPYPTYPHYSDDPSVVIATSDLYMYGDVITHNSYKSPDYVNSFKWDRKIAIGNTSTYEYNDEWAQMIKAHASMAKVDYPDNMDTPTFNTWGTGQGSTSFALWNGNEAGSTGYYFIVANRAGGEVGFGGFDNCQVIYSVGNYNYANYKLSLEPFTAILIRKG